MLRECVLHVSIQLTVKWSTSVAVPDRLASLSLKPCAAEFIRFVNRDKAYPEADYKTLGFVVLNSLPFRLFGGNPGV
ncbi:hypothetical protein MRX96_058027 [Rhipicephalus microplus]